MFQSHVLAHARQSLVAAALLVNTCALLAANAPAPNSSALATNLAFLEPEATVLTVGDLSLSWGDVSPAMRNLKVAGNPKATPSSEQLKKHLRTILQESATRGLLLQEARAMKLTVTPQDRKLFEADLEKSLANTPRGMTKQDVINSFNKAGSNMYKLSYEDALLLMKLDQVKFSDIKVPEDMLNQAKNYVQTMNKTLGQLNEARKQTCQEILDDKTSNTDKGFANLVREHSEGVESKWGGELKYDFTREELAEVCYMDKFDFKVGENTPVCETNSAFRIVRVLREVPQKDGQPAKLRVAQVLIGKVPMQETNEDALRATIAQRLRSAKIAEFAQALTKKYPVKSKIFPEGLWAKPAPKAASAPQGKTPQPTAKTTK